jgi:hypothetical protein
VVVGRQARFFGSPCMLDNRKSKKLIVNEYSVIFKGCNPVVFSVAMLMTSALAYYAASNGKGLTFDAA